jgi:hypothetical protein
MQRHASEETSSFSRQPPRLGNRRARSTGTDPAPSQNLTARLVSNLAWCAFGRASNWVEVPERLLPRVKMSRSQVSCNLSSKTIPIH